MLRMGGWERFQDLDNYLRGVFEHEDWGYGSREDEYDGIIREEICSSHKHIEWEICYDQTRAHPPPRTSPVFKVRNQNCLLALLYTRDFIRVELRRKGNCGRGDVRCWIGIKRDDGSVDPKMIVTGTLDMKKKCKWWRSASESSFPRSQLKKGYPKPDGNIVIFLRWSVKRVRTRVHRCSHVDEDLAVPSVGSIREEECDAHKYVEWNISYRSLRRYATSPVFRFGKQAYLFQLICTKDNISTVLYRMGPSIVFSARWCAGLKLGDGTYSHKSLSGKIDLRKNCELWQKTTLFKDFPRYILERRYLAQNRRLTFFFRINVKPYEIKEETCTHYIQDMSTLAAGSIVEEEGALYKKVEWTVDYKQEYETPSPVFVISKQRCLLELSWTDTEEVTLTLYRMGPPAARSLRWWVGVNIDRGIYHHFGSGCGKLCKEAGDSWIHKTLFIFRKKAGRTRLKVDFLVTLDSEPIIHDNAQGLQDINLSINQLIVFKVKDKEFTFSKAILSIRAPVFETFFLYDSLENRTGMVHIEDCEPSIFEAFLKYAESGNSMAVTKNNAFDLYVIADKYFLDNLRAECSEHIERNMSPHTIMAAICLALRCDDADLLESTRKFMSRRRTSFNTEVYANFCAENRDIANDVRLKGYKSFELYKEELKWWKVLSKPFRNWFFQLSKPIRNLFFRLSKPIRPWFIGISRPIRNWFFIIFSGWF